MRLLILLLCCLIGGLKPSVAQEVHVEGIVLDKDGGKVSGANIFIKGTVYGTSSLEDGTFSFTSPVLSDTVLIVRHLSLSQVEKRINLTQSINGLEVVMKPEYASLQEAVVDRKSRKVLDYGRSISFQTMDVDTSPGSDADIGSALKQLPGVQMIGESSGLFVRGGSKEESRVFIDGLHVSHPYFPGIPDLAQPLRFSPHHFEGITFNTGGYSAGYGDALSSILSLETKEHPQKNSTIVALLPYALQVGHDHLLKEKTSLGFDVSYTNFTPYYKVINHQTEWIKAPRSWTLHGKFNHQLSAKEKISWYGYWNSGEQKALEPDVEDQGALKPIAINNDYAFSLLTYNRQESEKSHYYLGYGVNYNQEVFGLNGEVNKPKFSQHQVRALNDYMWSPHVRSQIGSEVYFINNSLSDTLSLRDFTGHLWGETSITIHPRIVLRPGVRLDYSDRVKSWSVNPRVTVNFRTNRNGTLSLVAGKYSQQAEDKYNFQAPYAAYQRADHYIVSLQQQVLGHFLRMEGYIKSYKNLITPSLESKNLGKGFARGVDFFWRGQEVSPGLDYWVSYSYLNTKRQYLNYPYLATPDFSSPHTLHVVGKKFINSLGLFVGGSYSMMAGRPYFNPNSAVFLADRTSPVHQLNANLALLRKWGNTFVTTVLAVNNIANKKHVYTYRYSHQGDFRLPVTQPYGRSVLLGVFISIGKDRSDEILNQLQ